MVTALTIKKQAPLSFSQRIKSLFAPYEIEGRHYTDKATGLNLIHITYTQKFGSVRFDRIKRFAKISFIDTVCDKNLRLPQKLGFTRFFDNKLMNRYAVSFALLTLEQAKINPHKIRLCLYDPYGLYVSYVQQLLQYSSVLKIYTKQDELYLSESSKAYAYCGVSPIICDSIQALAPCDILIAPYKIKQPVPTDKRTVIFTSGQPSSPVNGIIFDSYIAKLPSALKKIKPAELDDTYFMSALYSAGGLDWLGSTAPDQCINSGNILSFEDCAKMLRSLIDADNL